MPKMSLLISRLRVVAPVALLVPAALLAQPTTHADLSLRAPHLLTTNAPSLHWGLEVRNDGPDAAHDVLVSVSASEGTVRWTSCPQVSAEGCFLPFVGAGVSEGVGLGFEVEGVPFPGEVTLVASVSSAVHDPNPGNNHISTTITRVRAPSLRFWITGDGPAAPAERVSFEANLHNDSPFEARDVRFSFHLSDGWSFRRSLSESLDCTSTGDTVTCVMGNIEGNTARQATFELQAPDDTAGSIHYEPVTLNTKDGVFGDRYYGVIVLSVFRDLAVTNTLDDAEGSLRKAIEAANAECGIGPLCRIVFEVAGGGSAVQTIQPRTPLPAIMAPGLTIEGATQTERVGDTNPHGPEVEINGSLLAEGDGLEFRNTFTLRNLVINGFPGNGVVIGARGTVEGCVIGADAAGTFAVPNGLRGVTVTSDHYGYSPVVIRHNLISGNSRSGIFVVGGAHVHVIGNRIGVAAGPELRRLPNGASGIYFGRRQNQALVQKNVIAFNAHAGIGNAPEARHVAIRGNAIFANGGLAIDHGLDGVSPEGIPHHRVPPVPIITSVLRDAGTGITTIRGTFAAGLYSGAEHVVELFANASTDPSGYGEAQSPIDAVAVGADGSFEVSHQGDLRGRYIAATGTLVTYGWDTRYASTSELSRAVRVDGEAEGEIPPSASLPAGADLSIAGEPFRHPVPAGVSTAVRFSIENHGPHVARNVVVEIRADGGVTLESASRACTRRADTLRCTLGTIGVAEADSIQIITRTPLELVRQTIEAAVSAETADPNPRNNQAVVEFDITAAGMWNAHLRQSSRVADPGEEVVFDMTLEHRSGLDATDVQVTLPIPEGWSFVGGSRDHWQCGQVSSAIVCRTPIVAAGAVESFTFTLRAPQQYQGKRAFSPSISSAQEEPRELQVFALFETWRWLPVTTAGDSGHGSFRAAIEELNRACLEVRCKIVFEIPEDETVAGAAVIRPLTPLPAVGAHQHSSFFTYEIDARTQPRYSGGATAVPMVVLDGALLAEGNGLELAGRQGSVRGFTIHGFPADGIVVRTHGNYGSRSVIADNYIGTDSRGQTAVPNERWGVSIISGFVDVASNLISGNGRSAVFSAGSPSLRIVGNQMGVAAGDPSRAIPNGASAIYIGGIDSGADISANTLANSPHFGVAISREAGYVAIRGNSIFANGGLGIDYGLDSVTFNDDPDRPENLPPYPVILSARWDESAQATRIEGIVESFGVNGGVVELFRDTTADPSGFGEARELIATIAVPGSREEDVQHFSVLVERDLRGQVVTSTWTRRYALGGYVSTSEISAAVPVE